MNQFLDLMMNPAEWVSRSLQAWHWAEPSPNACARCSGEGSLDLLPEMVPNLEAELLEELYHISNESQDADADAGGSNRSWPGLRAELTFCHGHGFSFGRSVGVRLLLQHNSRWFPCSTASVGVHPLSSILHCKLVTGLLLLETTWCC